MKMTWQCPKCSSLRIGYFDQLPDQDDAVRERALGAPPHAGYPRELWSRLAPVEAFVCADCGYFEEYVRNVAQVPWEKLKNFRWCRPPGDGGAKT